VTGAGQPGLAQTDDHSIECRTAVVHCLPLYGCM
jgi:hypothetical protein